MKQILLSPVSDHHTGAFWDYPTRFDSIGHARAWMDAFVTYYNHEHRHSGIGYYTPASVHYGTVKRPRFDAAPV